MGPGLCAPEPPVGAARRGHPGRRWLHRTGERVGVL